jgi:putative intracellular protease/amidase
MPFPSLLATTILLFAIVAPSIAQDKFALKGLDPVLLAQGKKVRGSAQISARRGRFRFLFADAKNRRAFEATPDRYGIQFNGTCTLHPDMKGDPNLFLVYNGKIYLAGSQMCLDAVKTSPATYIKALTERKKVAIMIFPGVQIIDYTGPYEVFGEAGYDVYTVAEKADPLTTNMGMVVTPSYTFADCPKPDILVLPGGDVPQTINQNDSRLKWIRERGKESHFTMSVCNGAFWLANSGLLDGKEATTFFGMLDDLKAKFPHVKVISDKRYVDNGQIMTTAGLSSGIDGALHMVEKLEGFERAHSIALGMEYNWQPESGYARGAFADKYLRRVLGRTGFALDDKVTEWRTVAQEGDTRKWQKDWEFRSASSSADLMKIIEAKLAEGWTKTDSRSTDDPMISSWKFTGEEGGAWTAVATLRSPSGAGAKFRLTIRLERT